MRACLLALIAIAFISPAQARSHSHKGSHHVARHQAHQFHHRHHVVHARMSREAPIISGYAMPKSFDQIDARESSVKRQTWQQPTSNQPAWQPPAETRAVSNGYAETAPVRTRGRVANPALDSMIARHAAANDVPAELVRRVVARESGGNPRARNGGALGLMQIKYATARGVGYTGSPAGLFDADTNMAYATRYLAGAYQAAGGNQNRAVALYASGYHGRGAAVARRSAPEVVAQNTWGQGAWEMQTAPVAMQGEYVTRRYTRHRARR